MSKDSEAKRFRRKKKRWLCRLRNWGGNETKAQTQVFWLAV